MVDNQSGSPAIDETAKAVVMRHLKIVISPKGLVYIELPKNAFMEHESSIEKIVYRLIK